MPDDDAKARDLREIAELRERAAGSRAFVHFIRDGAGATWLEQHAEELEAKADALEAKYKLPSS